MWLEMTNKTRNMQVLGMWLNTKPSTEKPKKGKGSYVRKSKTTKEKEYNEGTKSD